MNADIVLTFLQKEAKRQAIAYLNACHEKKSAQEQLDHASEKVQQYEACYRALEVAIQARVPVKTDMSWTLEAVTAERNRPE